MSSKEISPRPKLTYNELSIVNSKPKRADMMTVQKRKETFQGKWKKKYPLSPEVLANCGMYYAGYADCARCFYCGGGLKNWEDGDDPWMCHAQWYPKCHYLLLCKGRRFIDIVQRKTKDGKAFSLRDVEKEMNLPESLPLEVPTSKPVVCSQSSISELQKENDELKAEMLCKICMVEQVSMVLLPCGHIVACPDCSNDLKKCPICRANISGRARAELDDRIFV